MKPTFHVLFFPRFQAPESTSWTSSKRGVTVYKENIYADCLHVAGLVDVTVKCYLRVVQSSVRQCHRK